MINVREFDTSVFPQLLEFCKKESEEDHPASENMWTSDWETNSKTLPFLLTNTTRFSNNTGKFFLLYEDNDIVGCSGVYKSEYTERVILAGVRTWLTKPYRNKQHLKNSLLPVHKKWAVSQNADVVALSFNGYNSSAIKLFRIGQKTGNRGPDHLFYNNYNELDFPVVIQNTPQWVIYENLTDYRFDWKSIAATVS